MCGDQRKKVGELRQITDVPMLLFNGTVRCTSGGRAFSAVIIASLRLSPKQARARDRSHVCASRAFRRAARSVRTCATLPRPRMSPPHRRTAAPHRTANRILRNTAELPSHRQCARNCWNPVHIQSSITGLVQQWSQWQSRAAASHPPAPTISHKDVHVISMQQLQIRIDKNDISRLIVKSESGTSRFWKNNIALTTLAWPK